MSGQVRMKRLAAGLALALVAMGAGDTLAAKPVTVEPRKGYNSWPMVQALGDKLVCIYRMGSEHNPGEKGCGTFARVSSDRGKTWGPRATITNDPKCGESAIAKGVDSTGAALFWVRSYGPKPLFNLYRTVDGVHFDLISQPKLDKGPWMQVTDILHVPTVGLMAFWFGGSYGDDDRPRRWGVTTSADNGTNWTFRVCGENMKRAWWPTEPSGVYLGDGRILCVARTEGGGGRQLQVTSVDYGKTWSVRETNIRDVSASTPSLIYDAKTGLVHNYYYQRGMALLKCRRANAAEIFDHPMSWPEPKTLVDDKGLPGVDTGNANATVLGNRHYVTWYRGKAPDCEVVVMAVDPAVKCPPQDPSRVDQIAAWLPEKPGLGYACAADRATWQRIAARPESKEVISRAEKILRKPVVETPDEYYLDFTRNGNRTRFQDVNAKLNANLTTLIFAEIFENKGRFIDKIVAYFDAQCAQRSWTLPAHDSKLTCFNGKPHVDLGAGMKASLLAQQLVLLGDLLPAATRQKVCAEIDRRVFQPYLKTARTGDLLDHNHWWFSVEMNWNSVCNDTCTRAALLIEPDRRVRAEFVEAAERTAPLALRGYGDDGYCFEGMGYWNYGYGHYLFLGLAVRAATQGKVDLFADPKTKKVMEYAYGYQLQTDECPNFADGGGSPDHELFALGRQIWPDLVSTAGINAPMRPYYSWADALDSFMLRAFGQEPPPAKPMMDVLPARSWFPNAQVMIARDDGKGRGPLAVAVKGGTNAELHNHNDVGSYSIMFDGFEYAGDPAGEVYTRRTFSDRRYDSNVLNSYGHPVPRVGGKLQPMGPKFAAKVLKTDFSDSMDVVVLDLTACYPGVNLVSLVRTVTLDRSARAVTVSDEVSFSAPTEFETPIITYADVFFDYDKEKLQLRRSKKAALHVSVAAKGGEWNWATELVENPTKSSSKRLAVRFDKPVKTATVAITYAVP